MVRSSQDENFFQPVNKINDLIKVRNAVLRESARQKQKFDHNYHAA